MNDDAMRYPAGAPGPDHDAARIAHDPDFARLANARAGLGTVVVGLMVVVYFGYIALLAYAPGLMHTRVSTNVTIGFPLGLGVLVVTFLLVAFYVTRSSGRLDPLTASVAARAAR